MKIKPSFLIAFLLASVGLVSCIDENETDDVILEKDIKAIEKYLGSNPITGVKEYKEEIEGFYMFWEVSLGPEINRILALDTVTVDYTGKFLDNTIFDTSSEKVAKENGVYNSQRTYAPLKFPLGTGRGAIIGFEFAVSLMRKGEKAIVIFPSQLGYGKQGKDGIPPNSPLIFELELKDYKKGPNQ